MSTSDSTVLGVVILARHGDRQGFYQNPTNYAASLTSITPLGNVQELQLGQLLRSLYLNESSPSFVEGFNTTLFDQTQVQVRADAGGEGGVIFDSAISLLQGLFPPTTRYSTRLSNGTVVVAPLGGYQTVPIESVEPGNDISLEGWTSCSTFDAATNAFYQSEAFKQVAADHADFLKQLPQYLDGRPVTLDNMWNIFDFMNVQSIHDEAFNRTLPPTFLAQARHLANFHEYGVFSSPKLDGIGNIAGRTILPSVLNGFSRINNASDPLKMVYQSLSYKPFLSLFNMTGVAQVNPQLAGIVNYAAAVALELRQPISTNVHSGPVIRFRFKNGTDDDDFKTYNFMDGSSDIPLSTFVSQLSPVTINTTAAWCTLCNNTADRGCGALALAAEQGSASAHALAHHDRISPVGAGFLGAGLTLVVLAALVAGLMLLGWVHVGAAAKGARRTRSKDEGSDRESAEKV